MSFKVGSSQPQAGLRRDLGPVVNGATSQAQMRIQQHSPDPSEPADRGPDRVRNARSPSIQTKQAASSYTRPGLRAGSPPAAEYDRIVSVESRLSALSASMNNNRKPPAYSSQQGSMRPPNANAARQSVEKGFVPPQWKDLVGMSSERNSAPSEASSVAHSVGVSAMVGSAVADVERMSLEDRIRRIETSLDEKLIKVTQESMSVSVTLTKAVEERLTQRIDALRSEMGQASLKGSFPEVNTLRSELFDELSKSVGQEFSNLRLELAARGVPVMAGLPADVESIEQAGPQQARKTGIAGLVSVISDCVIEKVKEDQCIKNVSDQHEQLKSAIKELRSMPIEMSAKSSSSKAADVDAIQNQVQEMVKVCYSLAMELSSEREQRNSQFSDAAHRLKNMEEAMTSSRSSGSSVPSKTLQRPDRSPVTSTFQDQASKLRLGQLDEMARSLTPGGRAGSTSNKNLRPQASPQFQIRNIRDSSAHSHGSDDTTGQDWSSEVKALRSRLENIFHIGGEHSKEGLGTGSTGLSGTVGSLPIVEEASPPP